MDPFHDPTPARVGRRDDVRARNDAIAASARSHRFDEGAAVPLICECDSETCAELVRITLVELEQARRDDSYVISPGHRLAGLGEDEGGREYVLYRPG